MNQLRNFILYMKSFKVTKSDFLFMLLCLLLANFNTYAQKLNTGKKPNIVLIMVDDLGYECIGSYGGTSYKTPNINKLAANGVQFNQAYAQPLCTPTRVKLMTGKYNFRNWTAFGILTPSEKTFGHLMQDAGYATCMAGKWQLQSYDPVDYPGSEYRRDTGMKVEDAGFDDYCMFHVGHTEVKGSRYANPTIYQNGEFLESINGNYGPDIFSNFINNFINKQTNKPFFVYYPMVLTHNPFTPTPKSKSWKNPDDRLKEDTQNFKDMVEYTDKIVGDIVKNLEKKGLLDDTLILFYSDNGTNQDIYSKVGTKIIQGGKGLTTEAGIRVPFIASWPGTINKGIQTDELIDAVDFLPTILEAAGKPIPTNFLTDGQSFLPLLKGEKSNRREWIYMSYNPKPGVGKDDFYPAEFAMNKDYKLYGDGRFYNLRNDIFEKNVLNIENCTPQVKSISKKFERIIDSLKKYPSMGKMERYDMAFDSVISKYARIEIIAEGFTWSEGPVWVPKGQKLLFSDVPENKIYQWNNILGTSLYMSPSGYTSKAQNANSKGSNGLTIDSEGNLVLCQVTDRVVSKLKSISNPSNAIFEPIVSNFNSKKLNAPNDLVYDKLGNLYFTDPSFGLKEGEGEIGFNGVYFCNKKGDINLLDSELKAPNGIALSNDNRTLYVTDSDPSFPKILAYDILEEGKVSNKHVFFDVTELCQASISKQKPDGLKVDNKGNLFVAGPDGVLVFSPKAKHLGTIKTNKKTSNCAFSDDGKVLFITCDDLILRVILKPYDK